MVCPFAPSEKQALLEAQDVDDRARAMTALMSMAKAGENVARASGVH
jgi:Lon protease-like protein